MKNSNFFYLIISIVFKSYQKISRIKNRIHKIWITKQFKSIGKFSQIGFPIEIRGYEYISIGDNFVCNSRLRLDALKYTNVIPEVKIGDNVNINNDCHIGCVNKVILGDNVLIASKVYIGDHSHGKTDFKSLKTPPQKRKIFSKGPIIIKNNVWIGEGASILAGVTIGENSIIGTNAVVTKSVPPFSIAVGIPAKIITTYSK